MTTTQWLYRGKNLLKEIEMLNREYQAAYDRATNTVAKLNSDVVSGSKDPHKLDVLAELYEQTQRFIERDNKIIAEIQGAIMECEEVEHRRILLLRFVECKDWQTIEYEIEKSERQRKRIYKEAIKAVTPVVNQKMAL